jgi:1-deoxy-D-xylulose-5-phosphate synthase
MDDILSGINSPQDIKSLDIPQLTQLARELRLAIVKTIATTGGHLAPSLGVVELTIVLHYLFNTPTDKIVWDVGHQSYAHKLLTGRRELFETIRQYKGISGFPRRDESEFDAFGVGHASTAISAAFGIACARDLKKEQFKVLAVVGDGALTGGLSFEGLNNAGASGRDIVVILNDNSMSISPNVGAISMYLTGIISNPYYNRIKNEIWELTGKMDNMGPVIRKGVRRLEESLKAFITPGVLFERLGFRYFGPVDGHNIIALMELFQEVKRLKGPMLIHVLTKKGKGYKPAEKNAPIFHGLGKFDPQTGEVIQKTSIPSYTDVFGRTIVELGRENKELVAVTAAMEIGTGLSSFAKQFPERFFDVGIAEGHAVTFSAGLAAQGIRPFCAIYSSFLQRAYDMTIHDVALQNLPVVFCIDRAGLVGDDGPTHHGLFDLAFLRAVPRMAIMAPKDENELRHMLYTAVHYHDGPIAIRYPRAHGQGVPTTEPLLQLPIGISETLLRGEEIAVIAVGPLVYAALEAAKQIEAAHGLRITVINARFIKPIDAEMLQKTVHQHRLIVTVEEGTLNGGFGSRVAEFVADQRMQTIELIRLGIPDQFIEQGDRAILLKLLGLSPEGIIQAVYKSATFQNLTTRTFTMHPQNAGAL